MALNDRQIKNLHHRERRYELSDGGGLYLVVLTTGIKTWVLRYRFDNRARRLYLGQYPAISLSEARQHAAEAKQKVLRGIDPGEIKKQEREKAKKAPTFSDMLEEFWSRELKEKISGPETKRLLERDCLPTWKHTKVKSITRRDIVILLDKVRDRAPITANRVHGALTRFFNFCAERGVIDDSPCTRIKKTKEKSRDRILTDDEIKILWANLDEIDIWHNTRLAIKFLLVTGQRPGEVVNMTWDEIINDVWTIPAERMKNKEPHSIPLTETALDILESAKGFQNSKFVFASSYDNGQKPISRPSMGRAILRHLKNGNQDRNKVNKKNLGIEKFTPHDLRRTVRSKLAELGVDDVVAERVLSHKLQGIAAVYNRYDYLSEKRQALEKWERHLRRLVGLEMDKGKVLAFTG